MSRKMLMTVLVLIIVLVIAVVMNGDRLYDWLLAMHGGHPAH